MPRAEVGIDGMSRHCALRRAPRGIRVPRNFPQLLRRLWWRDSVRHDDLTDNDDALQQHDNEHDDDKHIDDRDDDES